LANSRIIIWRTIQVIVVLTSVALSWYAGREALADYYSQDSYEVLLEWRRSPPDVSEWQAARASLERAIALSPAHPTYHHRMGRIAHMGMFVDPERRNRHAQAAEAALRASLRIRPEWPHAWANLALLKAVLGEYDDEFARALSNAVRYGPWETDVHEMVAAIGARGLLWFSEDIEAKVLANNARAIMSAVRGAPQRVMRRVAGYSERDQGLQATYWGAALAQGEWDPQRAATFTRVVLDFWKYYSDDIRRELVRTMAGLSPDSAAWRIVRRSERAGNVCAYLPEGPAFDQNCTKK